MDEYLNFPRSSKSTSYGGTSMNSNSGSSSSSISRSSMNDSREDMNYNQRLKGYHEQSHDDFHSSYQGSRSGSSSSSSGIYKMGFSGSSDNDYQSRPYSSKYDHYNGNNNSINSSNYQHQSASSSSSSRYPASSSLSSSLHQSARGSPLNPFSSSSINGNTNNNNNQHVDNVLSFNRGYGNTREVSEETEYPRYKSISSPKPPISPIHHHHQQQQKETKINYHDQRAINGNYIAVNDESKSGYHSDRDSTRKRTRSIGPDDLTEYTIESKFDHGYHRNNSSYSTSAYANNDLASSISMKTTTMPNPQMEKAERERLQGMIQHFKGYVEAQERELHGNEFKEGMLLSEKETYTRYHEDDIIQPEIVKLHKLYVDQSKKKKKLALLESRRVFKQPVILPKKIVEKRNISFDIKDLKDLIIDTSPTRPFSS